MASGASLANRPAVLIVDDDVGMCISFQTQLRRLGFQVGIVHSGRDGITVAKSGGFDLAIIDLALGDMLATDMIRQLRADRVDIPFALITGHWNRQSTDEAIRLGALDVMWKPVWVEELPARLLAVWSQCDRTSTHMDQIADQFIRECIGNSFNRGTGIQP